MTKSGSPGGVFEFLKGPWQQRAIRIAVATILGGAPTLHFGLDMCLIPAVVAICLGFPSSPYLGKSLHLTVMVAAGGIAGCLATALTGVVQLLARPDPRDGATDSDSESDGDPAWPGHVPSFAFVPFLCLAFFVFVFQLASQRVGARANAWGEAWSEAHRHTMTPATSPSVTPSPSSASIASLQSVGSVAPPPHASHLRWREQHQMEEVGGLGVGAGRSRRRGGDDQIPPPGGWLSSPDGSMGQSRAASVVAQMISIIAIGSTWHAGGEGMIEASYRISLGLIVIGPAIVIMTICVPPHVATEREQMRVRLAGAMCGIARCVRIFSARLEGIGARRPGDPEGSGGETPESPSRDDARESSESSPVRSGSERSRAGSDTMDSYSSDGGGDARDTAVRNSPGTGFAEESDGPGHDGPGHDGPGHPARSAADASVPWCADEDSVSGGTFVTAEGSDVDAGRPVVRRQWDEDPGNARSLDAEISSVVAMLAAARAHASMARFEMVPTRTGGAFAHSAWASAIDSIASHLLYLRAMQFALFPRIAYAESTKRAYLAPMAKCHGVLLESLAKDLEVLARLVEDPRGEGEGSRQCVAASRGEAAGRHQSETVADALIRARATLMDLHARPDAKRREALFVDDAASVVSLFHVLSSVIHLCQGAEATRTAVDFATTESRTVSHALTTIAIPPLLFFASVVEPVTSLLAGAFAAVRGAVRGRATTGRGASASPSSSPSSTAPAGRPRRERRGGGAAAGDSNADDAVPGRTGRLRRSIGPHPGRTALASALRGTFGCALLSLPIFMSGSFEVSHRVQLWWLPVSLVIALQPTRQATRSRALWRALGTVIGCASGALVSLMKLTSSLLALTLWRAVGAIVATATAAANAQYAYAAFLGLFLADVVVLCADSDSEAAELAAWRAALNVTGVLAAVVISRAWPRSAADVARWDLARCCSLTGVAFDALVRGYVRGPGPDLAAIDHKRLHALCASAAVAAAAARARASEPGVAPDVARAVSEVEILLAMARALLLRLEQMPLTGAGVFTCRVHEVYVLELKPHIVEIAELVQKSMSMITLHLVTNAAPALEASGDLSAAADREGDESMHPATPEGRALRRIFSAFEDIRARRYTQAPNMELMPLADIVRFASFLHLLRRFVIQLRNAHVAVSEACDLSPVGGDQWAVV